MSVDFAGMPIFFTHKSTVLIVADTFLIKWNINSNIKQARHVK